MNLRLLTYRLGYVVSVKAIGFVALLCAVVVKQCTSENPQNNGFEFANPLFGSGGTGFGSGGHNPGAQYPFGALRMGPDTALQVFGFNVVSSFDHYGGYNYEDDHIRAFSHTHLVGAGVGDFGNFGFMPLVLRSDIGDKPLKRTLIKPRGHTSKFSHSEEIAKPGYYSVKLGAPSSSFVELAASSTHTGSHKYTWLPPSSTGTEYSCGFLVDVCHTALGKSESCKNASAEIFRLDSQTIRVELSLKMAGSLSRRSIFGGVDMFLVAKVHMPGEVITRFWVDDQLLPQDSTTHATSNTGSLGLYISKRCKNTSNTVNIDVGLSFVDIRQANINLQRMGKNSAPPSNFENVRNDSKTVWESYFAPIQVYQGNELNKESTSFLVKFYSAIYNSLKAPTRWSEYGGVYAGMDGNVHTVGTASDDMRSNAYTDMSLWDTHRTQFPWLSFTQPDVYKDVLGSLQDMARVGGDIPRWPLANVYTGCMIGSHGMVSIAEAFVKGQAQKLNKTFIYEKMKLAATVPRPHGGRQSIGDYLKYGFVPYDDQHNAASLTLAYAFDDSAVASVASKLGIRADAATFSKRSQNAYKLFGLGRTVCYVHALKTVLSVVHRAKKLAPPILSNTVTLKETHCSGYGLFLMILAVWSTYFRTTNRSHPH